jgi:hypothetical protein
MTSFDDQRGRARDAAQESIRQLLGVGISWRRIAEAYAAAAVKLALEHGGTQDARDLLTSLGMIVHQHEETERDGPAGA